MTVPMRRKRVCKALSTGFVFPPTSILCLSNKPDRPQLGISAKTFATFDSTVTNARQVERDRSRARHSASGVYPREGGIDFLDRSWSYHSGRAFLSATQLASSAPCKVEAPLANPSSHISVPQRRMVNALTDYRLLRFHTHRQGCASSLPWRAWHRYRFPPSGLPKLYCRELAAARAAGKMVAEVDRETHAAIDGLRCIEQRKYSRLSSCTRDTRTSSDNLRAILRDHSVAWQ